MPISLLPPRKNEKQIEKSIDAGTQVVYYDRRRFASVNPMLERVNRLKNSGENRANENPVVNLSGYRVPINL